MLDRIQFRIQPIDQIRKRKQWHKEMQQREKQFAEFVEKEKRKKASVFQRKRRKSGGLTMTKRNELDRDDLEQLMVLLSEFDCVYKLNNADEEAINKAIDVVGRECEMRRKLENWQ